MKHASAVNTVSSKWILTLEVQASTPSETKALGDALTTDESIEWNEEHRNLLMEHLKEIQRLTVEGGAERNHQQIGKCRNCSRKHVCTDSLT